MMAINKPMNINDLPIDIIKAIFGYIGPIGLLGLKERAKLRLVCHLWAKMVPIEHGIINGKATYTSQEFIDNQYIDYYPSSNYDQLWPPVRAIRVLNIHSGGLSAQRLARSLIFNFDKLTNVYHLIIDLAPTDEILALFTNLKILTINADICQIVRLPACITPYHAPIDHFNELLKYVDKLRIEHRRCRCMERYTDSTGALCRCKY
jgi:hypothetical protein